MHTRAPNSALVEPLPKPEQTLNRRLRRRNRRVPFKRPEHPRIIFPPILDINYFRYFLNILENYNPMDDEPMWAIDRIVAPTLGSAIIIPETAEFAIKGKSVPEKNRCITVNLHHDGVFIMSPFEYVFGDEKQITDIHFEGTPLKLGIKIIKTDSDVDEFVNFGYQNKWQVNLYVEHSGYDALDIRDQEETMADDGTQNQESFLNLILIYATREKQIIRKRARVRVFCWGEVGKIMGVVGYGGEAAGKGEVSTPSITGSLACGTLNCGCDGCGEKYCGCDDCCGKYWVVEYFLDSRNFGSRMVVVVDDTTIVLDKLDRVIIVFQKEDTATKNLSFVTPG
uniref:Zinc finger, PMZ-type n=1 Tax=Tanacetum cinerariifolium TaxID=118510 RepID=A0A6L2N2A8_TANCI|nr:zinc finger, PMZ-type [Tanacetum cinerariifolium]